MRTTVAAADADLPPDLRLPFRFVVECRVVDREGFAVEAAQLAVSPALGAWNAWPQLSDPDGAIRVEWYGRTAQQELALGILESGRVRAPRLLQVSAGRPRQLTLLGRQTATCHAAVADVDCNACHTAPDAPDPTDPTADDELLHPWVSFAAMEPRSEPDGGETQHDTEVEAYEAEFARAAYAPEPVPIVLGAIQAGRLSALRRLFASETPDPEPDSTGSVAGLVLGSDGTPLPNQWIALDGRFTRPSNRRRSDDEGRFEFRGLPSGPTRLRVSIRGIGRAEVAATVAPGRTTDVVLRVEPGPTVRGTVEAPSRSDEAGWHVLLEDALGGFATTAPLAEDGSFRLEGVPPRPGKLTLWTGRSDRPPLGWMDTVLPDGAAPRLDLTDAGRAAQGTLVLRPMRDPAERAHPSTLEARLWQRDTGFGAVAGIDADGSIRFEGLPAGHYRITVGDAAAGWTDLGWQWVDGRSTRDLGELRLRPAARLELTGDLAAFTTVELYRQDAATDRFFTALDPQQPAELRIPAGRWLVLAQAARGPLRAHRFTVSPDERRTLDASQLQDDASRPR